LAEVVVVAPVARLPFHDALVTVMFGPSCDQSPFQPFCSFWLPAKEKRRVQPLRASPRLVMPTLAVNPEPQSFLV
jgi:hypothetical protein